MKTIGIILCSIGGAMSVYMMVFLFGTLFEGEREIDIEINGQSIYSDDYEYVDDVENLRVITNYDKMLEMLIWIAPLSLVFMGIGGFMIKKGRETEEKQSSKNIKDDLLEKF
jgi:hypothetical protein|tara:strand:- start:179 stop:514 length:336 start_codon:yes stop_codon:yes gene_type:complete